MRVLSAMWETEPDHFDLLSQQTRLVATRCISRDILLVDENGIVRQATNPEAAGQSVADRDYFRNAIEDPPGRGQLFIGSANIDSIFRTWHINVALALRHPDGGFAGMVVTDYRLQILTVVFARTDVDDNGLVALIGLTDGLIRAAVGPAAVDPDASQLNTPMHRAILRQRGGLWTGVSAPDSVPRLHAFQEIAGRDLVVVVAMDSALALAPLEWWRWQAFGYAIGSSALLLMVAAMTLRTTVVAARREKATEAEKAELGLATTHLEIARREANDIAVQLQATLRGMTDGIAMVDANLCLVELNAQFAEIIGVPVENLRIGTPMADILLMQAERGEFGQVDAAAEVSRRIELMRTARRGLTQRRTGPRGIRYARAGNPAAGNRARRPSGEHRGAWPAHGARGRSLDFPIVRSLARHHRQ